MEPKEPRLLAGCCAYSYRKYLEHGPMTMEDFILKGAELGLQGVDLTAYYLKSTDPAYLAGLPLDVNVLFMTIMATKMPLVGRG